MHEQTGSETEKRDSKIESLISQIKSRFVYWDTFSIKFIWHKKIVCNNTETLITYSIKIHFYGFINIVEIQVCYPAGFSTLLIIVYRKLLE